MDVNIAAADGARQLAAAASGGVSSSGL